MTDYRTILERDLERVARPASFTFDDVSRRRDRKRRNQRIAAGVVGIALALAGVAVAMVTIRSANVPADETPSPRPIPTPSLEPLFELGRGIYLVDMAGGEVARMPRRRHLHPWRRSVRRVPRWHEAAVRGPRS